MPLRFSTSHEVIQWTNTTKSFFTPTHHAPPRHPCYNAGVSGEALKEEPSNLGTNAEVLARLTVRCKMGIWPSGNQVFAGKRHPRS